MFKKTFFEQKFGKILQRRCFKELFQSFLMLRVPFNFLARTSTCTVKIYWKRPRHSEDFIINVNITVISLLTNERFPFKLW